MAGRGDPLRGAASGGQAAQDRGRGAALQGGRPAYTREPAAKDQGEEEAEGGQEEKVSRACLGWLGWAGVTGGGGGHVRQRVPLLCPLSAKSAKRRYRIADFAQ